MGSSLGLFMAWPRATRIAALTGQGIAVVLGLWAIATGQVMLLVISVLIFLSAGSVKVREQAISVLARVRAGEAVNRGAAVLHEDERLSDVLRRLLTGHQPDFAVMRNGELAGVVMRHRVLEALASGRGDLPVTALLDPGIPRVQAEDTLALVQGRMQESESPVAAVYDGPVYLGLISAEDIAEAHALLSAARAQRWTQPEPAAWRS